MLLFSWPCQRRFPLPILQNYSKLNQPATGNMRKKRREKCATTKIGIAISPY
jgi:hypothetical protein